MNLGLSEARIDALIGKRNHLEFLNTRNELYRERGMKTNPPDRKEAVRLMAQYPNLIRRPILICGDEILLGFDQESYRIRMCP